ncbi:MAG: hypothetical protein IPF52_16120 [Saprospiraceae bacterium]|nr:hypothetical protein [Saprospiraceae bacterium]
MINYFYKLIFYSFILVVGFSCKPDSAKVKKSDFIRIGGESHINQKDSLYADLYHKVVFLQDFKSTDSILAAKIQDGILTRNTVNMKQYYTDFFLLPDVLHNSLHSEKYAKQAEELLFTKHDFSIDWNLTYALFLFNRETKNVQKCMEFASRLQEMTSKHPIPETKAVASLTMGEASELNGNYKLAISHLFNSLSSISNSPRVDIHIQILSSLSKFYKNHFMYKNALDYKIQEMKLYQPKNLMDSIQYFHSELHYHHLTNIINDNQLFEIEKIQEIITFSKKNKCLRLYEYSTAFLRTTLISSNRIKELKTYFQSIDEEELDDLKVHSPYIYYIFYAFVNEEDGQILKAKEAYEKAISELDKKPGQENRESIIHLQYAQFLSRNNDTNNAEIHYIKAIDNARIAKNEMYEITSSKAAEDYFSKRKNYEKAYYFLNNYHKLLADKSLASMDQDVFKIEIETEQKIMEENKRLVELYEEKLHQGQYNLISIFCISLMLILLISVRFKVPIWFIRVVGYMGVIFIFEFSILRIDSVVHEITHHTPWKIFAIKVTLISILLPLHHIIEKQLIKFLIARRQAEGNLFSFNFEFIRRWFKKLDAPDNEH